jgi:hypothetical protein
MNKRTLAYLTKNLITHSKIIQINNLVILKIKI